MMSDTVADKNGSVGAMPTNGFVLSSTFVADTLEQHVRYGDAGMCLHKEGTEMGR
jgi:hypothetical protein